MISKANFECQANLNVLEVSKDSNKIELIEKDNQKMYNTLKLEKQSTNLTLTFS